MLPIMRTIKFIQPIWNYCTFLAQHNIFCSFPLTRFIFFSVDALNPTILLWKLCIKNRGWNYVNFFFQLLYYKNICWLLRSLDPNNEYKGGCIKHSDLLPLWTPYIVLNFFPWFRPLCGWSRTSQHDWRAQHDPHNCKSFQQGDLF